MRNFIQNLKNLKYLKSLMQIFGKTDKTAKTDSANFAVVGGEKSVASEIAVGATGEQYSMNIQQISNLSLSVNPARVRVLSRITCTLPVLAPVSILSRLCLVSLILMTMSVGNVWGKLTGKVAVGLGKGTAYVETHSNYFDILVEGPNSTSNGTQASASASTGSASWAYCKFSATAADGYYFAGWYTNSSCSGSASSSKNPYSTSSQKKGDRVDEYWAKFSPNAYKVKFNKNTGSGTMNDQSFTYDVAQNLTSNAFTKTGYTFAGWATSADGAVVYSNGQSVSNLTTTKDGTVNLYAKWTANTYYVHFGGNGSTGGSMSDQSFTYNAAAKNLTKNAYTKTDVVAFNSNGGSAVESISKSATFVGWATSATGDKVYNDEHSVSNLSSTADDVINLYAKWSQTNTITLPTATKSGSVLAGWSDGKNNVGEAGATYSVPLNGITLTAIWIDKYTPTMTGANHSMEVGDEQAGAFSLEHTYNPEARITVKSISAVNNGDGKVIEYDATNNKIIAHNAGTAEIYLEQAETETIKYGKSATYIYTVTKKDNTLSVAEDAYTGKYVEDVIANIVSDKNSDATVTTSSAVAGMTNEDAAKIAYYNVYDNKIYMPNTGAASFTSKTITINIAQAETYKYKPVSKSITLTVNKYQTTFTGSAYNLMVDGAQIANYTYTNTSVSEPTNNSANDFYYTIDEISYANQAKNKKYNSLDSLVRFTPSTKELKALNAGSGKITLHQKETYKYTGATASYNVNIYKYNSAFASVVNKTVNVDADVESNYTLNYSKPDNNYIASVGNHSQSATPAEGEASGDFYYTLTHDVQTSVTTGSLNGAIVISYDAAYKTATGKNKGVATVHLYQKETYKYNATDTSFTVTVNKLPNALSCSWGANTWSNSMNFDSELDVTFSATNTNYTIAPIVLTQTFGKDTAIYSEGGHKIVSNFHKGNATWIVSQAETYKYVAPKEKSLSVNVNVVTTSCDVITRNIGDGNETTASNVGEINIPKVGSGNVLTFEMKKNHSAGNQATVRFYDDNNALLKTEKPEAKWLTSFNDADPITLPANTKKITFGMGGTFTDSDDPYIKNIHISRKTWLTLQDKEGNAISSLTLPTNKTNPNSVTPNSTTAKFYVDYSVCASQIKVASDNDHITVSESAFNVNANRKEITVTYTSADPETITASIMVYTPYEHKTLVINAETEQQSPVLVWGELYQTNPVVLPITFSDDAAAHTVNNVVPVTYSVLPEEASIIEVAADGASFTVKNAGTAHLTATTLGTDIWKSISETKVINATDKKIQNIVWNQNFTRALSVGDVKTMEAKVFVLDLKTGLESENADRSAMIQYSCPDNNGVIEKVNNTTFRVIGDGATSITASVGGDANYEAATSVSKLVRVRAPQSDDCDPTLMHEGTSEIEFYSNIDLGMPKITHDVELNRENGTPDKLSFYVRGVPYKYFDRLVGAIDVYQSTDGGEHWGSKLTSVTPDKNATAWSDTVQLSPNTTHLRFVREQGGQGYHYVGAINVTALPSFELQSQDINLGSITVGADFQGTIPVTYTNTKGDLTVTKSNNNNGLTIQDEIEAECGTRETYELPFTITPTVIGLWSNSVTITDPVRNMSATINLTATATKGDQSINWNPALNIKTVDHVALCATATSGLPVSYEITDDGDGVAAMVNGEVVIYKPGEFTITASQGGDDNFEPAPDIEKTFTVSITTPEVVMPAIAATMKVGRPLSSAKFLDGSANVEGDFTWVDGAEKMNTVGVFTKDIVFTPANPNHYEPVNGTATVDVQTIVPVFENTLTASDITYGESLSTSELSTEPVVRDTFNNVEVTGKFGWKTPTTELDAGTSNAAVLFTPNNTDWYESVEFEVAVHVNKATPIIHDVTVGDITIGQTLAEAGLTYSSTPDGDLRWAPSVKTDSVYGTEGDYKLPYIFTPGNDNYLTISDSVVLHVFGGYVFVGNINTQWTEVGNWEHSQKPGPTDNVLVKKNLEISTDVEVGKLTINKDVEVVVKDGASLIVNDGSVAGREYGNLIVEKGGKVDVNGTLRVGDLTVETSIGSSEGTSKSGQIIQAENIAYANAYIEINMDPSGVVNYESQWYGFTVPFEVDIHDGISRKEGDAYRDCIYGTDCSIVEYDAAKRLATGKGWKSVSSSRLSPGHFYLMTVNASYNTYRFKAAESSYSAVTEKSLTTNGTGADANWNGVGNSTLQHVKASYDGGSYVQVFQNGLNAYKTVPTSSTTFVVGCPFFIQATEASTLTLTPSLPLTKGMAYYAPRREQEEQTEAICVNFSAGDGSYSDPIYVSASDKEQDTYVLGHDLSKAGESTIVPQMWVKAYGKKLSVHESALQGNNATCALGLYAPKEGNYKLAIEKAPEDADLFLTYKGNVIWNLSSGPYVFKLAKGTTEGYGLRISARVEQVTPGSNDASLDDQAARKVLINNMLYIITPEGKMYDATGKVAK